MLELQLQGTGRWLMPARLDRSSTHNLSTTGSRYPLMGYAKGPLENGHSIRHEEPYKHGRLEDFPDEFYMLYEFPWLGGEIIRDVRDAAEADPTRRVAVVEITAGDFKSQLVHVTRSG